MKEASPIYIKITTRVLIAILFSSAISCTNGSKTEDSKTIADRHNEAKFENISSEEDARFMAEAAEISLEEARLGKLAQQNCGMMEVKELGMMMESGHEKSFKSCADLAQKKSISVPSAPTEKSMQFYKKLNTVKGKNFDKLYCEKMVNDHRDAVAKFEAASTESNDADIRAWATLTLAALRSHLDLAMICEQKCKTMP